MVRIGWAFNEFLAGVKYSKRTIVEILIHSSIENFMPELKLNNEQKVEYIFVVSPYCRP